MTDIAQAVNVYADEHPELPRDAIQSLAEQLHSDPSFFAEVAGNAIKASFAAQTRTRVLTKRYNGSQWAEDAGQAAWLKARTSTIDRAKEGLSDREILRLASNVKDEVTRPHRGAKLTRLDVSQLQSATLDDEPLRFISDSVDKGVLGILKTLPGRIKAVLATRGIYPKQGGKQPTIVDVCEIASALDLPEESIIARLKMIREGRLSDAAVRQSECRALKIADSALAEHHIKIGKRGIITERLIGIVAGLGLLLGSLTAGPTGTPSGEIASHQRESADEVTVQSAWVCPPEQRQLASHQRSLDPSDQSQERSHQRTVVNL